METKEVKTGKDKILDIARRASPIDAIAELIWNALDAEATEVEVTVSVGDLGGTEEVTIRDNGAGMTYAMASEVFTVDGDSWKKTARFSPTIKRPMHGRLGRGRFLAYALGDTATWSTVTASVDGNALTTITGSQSIPNRYVFDGPTPTSEDCGTTVTIVTRQDQKSARLADKSFVLPLTARLAPTLFGLTDTTVTYRTIRLNPEEYMSKQIELDVPLETSELQGYPPPHLLLVEWGQDMRARKLYLCDENGAVVTEHDPAGMPPAPIYWTAYLKWQGFGDSELMGIADLHHPEVRHAVLIAAADKAVADYLAQVLDEKRGHLIQTWKAEGVYPYHGEPASITDEIEREVFDVVAVVASAAIGKETKNKKLSLQLLKQSVRSEPTNTRKILQAVLNLDEAEKDVLADLLERTRFTAIIKTAQTIANRADFIRGLSRLSFSDETRTTFREVDQLHPMLVKEPWVFGDEWTLSLSESGLTTVVKSLVGKLGKDVEFSSDPVVLPSGRRGRVDMVFHRVLPESESTRHLVVELKRPMRLGMPEYGQLNDYATAIAGHPSVANAPNRWDFWLIGTDIDQSLRNIVRQDQPGLAANTGSYRLWVMTWSELLDRADRRLKAFQDALEILSTDETSRAYLNSKHAEFVPTEKPKEAA